MRRLIVTAALAGAVMGCKETPTTLEPGHPVTLRGEIAAGVECPLLVDRAGRRVSLAGDLGRFKVGDRVCVSGTVAEISYCMEGEATIAVTSIAAEDSCR